MAVLDFLEDPLENETPKDILVDLSVIEEIPMYCRGGEHCCYIGHANRCGEGEGDCNTDNDCDGSLVCGQNNCLKTRNAGGLYDDQDDCCEKACTPEHPCEHGDGTCSTDDDCLGQAVVCGLGNCMNEQTFPQTKFPNNYFAEYFNSTDNCCVKLCDPLFKCDINEFGCSSDDECQDGLFCDKIDNTCKDIDECNIDNGKSAGIYECGMNTYCSNTDKSFTCNCNDGYTNFIKYEGCSDINECSTTASCGSRAVCINTIGSYLCVCKEGYTGTYSSCYDIDECKLGMHTCNTYPTFNTETSYISGAKKFFTSAPFTLDDGKYHSFRFDLQSYDTSGIGVGNGDEEVLFYINPNSVDVKYREGEVVTTISSINDLPSAARIGKNFVPYQFGFQLQSSLINIDFGALGSNIGESITYSKFPSNFTSYSFESVKDFAFWRKVRKNGPYTMQYCINTIGSFLCTGIDNFGIGFGGNTDSSRETSTDVSIITSAMFSCAAHIIPKLEYNVYGHGIANLDNYLLVCGGFEENGYKYYASNSCFKFDLNNPSEGWTGSTALPYVIGHHSMVSYGSSIYVFGGTDARISRDDLLQFSQIGGSWVYRAQMYYNAHGVGGIADEDGGRLWTFGGYTNRYGKRSTVTYYDVANDKWTYHGELKYASEYNACTIVWDKHSNKKILCLLTGYSTIYFMSVNSSNWYSGGSMYSSSSRYYSHTAAKLITFNHYQAAIVSGETTRFDISLSNFYTYDSTISSTKIRFNYKYLQNFGYHTGWATIRSEKNYKATANCLASQTYAAIGWGGDQNTQWSVVLRQRNRYDLGNFETCHTRIIPDLIPGKKSPGIVVVNYFIIVCGGAEYLMEPTEECYFLDTNDVNITKYEEVKIKGWNTMESMPTARMSFSLESYADVVFAIGGETSTDSATTSVDRWTLNTGWIRSTDLPEPLSETCSTPYEGKGKIFVGGGRGKVSVNKKLFVLDVALETWSEHSSIGISEGSCGMSIVQHREDGHMLLYVVGGGKSYYYDLTAEQNSGSSSWRTVGAKYSSSYTRLVSLSMSEMLEVSYCNKKTFYVEFQKS